jgi:hypothetical protein
LGWVQDVSGQIAIEGRVAVGGRAEGVAKGVLPETPGIVVELVEEFQGRPIRFETKDALAELEVFAADVAPKV